LTKIKELLKTEGNETVTNCHALKMIAAILNGDEIIKCVILTDVRIHLLIIRRYKILAISLKHLGLPKCNK
jgi:hypothetical protein